MKNKKDIFNNIVDNDNIVKNIQERQGIVLRTIQPDCIPANIYTIETEIVELQRILGKSLWLIGERLCHIRNRQLYKHKGYDTFEQYTKEMFNMSRGYANRCILLYENIPFVATLLHEESKLINILDKTKDKEQIDKYINMLEDKNITVRKLVEILKEDFKKEKDKEETKTDYKGLFFNISEKKITIEKKRISKYLGKNNSNVEKELQDLISKFEIELLELFNRYDIP